MCIKLKLQLNSTRNTTNRESLKPKFLPSLRRIYSLPVLSLFLPFFLFSTRFRLFVWFCSGCLISRKEKIICRLFWVVLW
ncbi:hypothetical protein VNO78_15763 [Psophocarpus tetragonolobus]|uniref:Uncharacterized protein n=1 Tax=Psophocarpus tetragonolobus TaxID=3891 RepID=A0AAN9SH22_PSOTE